MSIDCFLMEIYSFQLLSHSLFLMQDFFSLTLCKNLRFIGLVFQKVPVRAQRYLYLLKNKLLTICKFFLVICRSELITVDFYNLYVLFHGYWLLKEWETAKAWVSLALLYNSEMELRFWIDDSSHMSTHTTKSLQIHSQIAQLLPYHPEV